MLKINIGKSKTGILDCVFLPFNQNLEIEIVALATIGMKNSCFCHNSHKMS